MMMGAMRVRVNGKEVPVDHERFMLLKLIDERGSISSASHDSGIPYRSALAYIRRLEEILGTRIVKTRRGGRGGGGGSRLTETGKKIVREYIKLKKGLERHSASNEIRGVVKEVLEDGGIRIQAGSSIIEAAGYDDVVEGEAVTLLIEPEDIVIMPERQVSSMRNVIPGTVKGMEMQGDTVTVKIDIGDGLELDTSITSRSLKSLKLKLGMNIFAGFKAVAVTIVK